MTRAVLIAVLAVLVLGAGSQAGVRRAACTAGLTKWNGLDARVFCGPAKATVHYGTNVLTYKGGECEKTAKYVALNIGEVILGQTRKPKPDYFGLDIGVSGKPASQDGTYNGGVLALDFKGKSYVTDGTSMKITLAGNRSHGTFTAKSLFLSPAVKITGTFSC